MLTVAVGDDVCNGIISKLGASSTICSLVIESSGAICRGES